MWSHAQTDRSTPEAGGMLLGRLIAGADDAIVDRVTLPSPDDHASRFHFFRARRPANLVIRKHWEQSSATCNYLGEWHTHPEDRPTPSCVDLRNWRRILTKSTFEQDFLLFIIVGRVELRVWELREGERVPRLLEPVYERNDNPRKAAEGGS
jgi:integrative and conjugative element protein (TIGR02256 family)